MGIANTQMYEKAIKAMAKQRVTLEVLSYHASAQEEEAQKVAVSLSSINSIYLSIYNTLKYFPNRSNHFPELNTYFVKKNLQFICLQSFGFKKHLFDFFYLMLFLFKFLYEMQILF